MNRLRLLILFTSLGADLWLYVESGDTDCAASRQVTQALVTPIEELAAERPNTQVIRDYLSELHQAREDLQSVGTVTLQTRDECRLHWSHPCPSWALSKYSEPRPVNEDALLHPVLIVRHLEYVSKLADMAIYHNPRESRLVKAYWLKDHEMRRVETADGYEDVDCSFPVLPPVPMVRAQWPWRMTSVLKYSDDGKQKSWFIQRSGGLSDAEVLRALDAGTGILCGGVPE